MSDRYRQGNGQPRNIYDEWDADPDAPGHGRWLATAGRPVDAEFIVECLNLMEDEGYSRTPLILRGEEIIEEVTPE